MKVYHGSDILIEAIDLTKSKPGKDFGRGFYVNTYQQLINEHTGLYQKPWNEIYDMLLRESKINYNHSTLYDRTTM